MLKELSLWLLAAFFLFAGINHFRVPAFYLTMMPDYLAWRIPLVYVSGGAEIILGALLIMPQWSRRAAWGLIVLSIAVFPANIHMALHPEEFEWADPLVLWLRLPLQGVLLAWIYWHTRPDVKPSKPAKPANSTAAAASSSTPPAP
ncbi:MAG: DoxX family protein [Burkholderiales bacterium]